MSIEYECDTEVAAELHQCPKCKGINWADGMHPFIVELTGAEAVRCWRCKHLFWGNEYHKETYGGNIKEAKMEDGVPDPMIPTEILETLTDVATSEMNSLTMAIKKEDTEYDEIVQQLRHLEYCVNYMKRLLVEGETKPFPLSSEAPF